MDRNAMNEVQTAATPDLERIIADFASLKRDFTELVGHVGSGAVNGAGDAAGALRESVGRLGEKTRGVYDALASQGQRSAKAIGQQIEKRPVTSLLIAFGVGLIASRLLSR